ncbi:MAG: hypothetical protein OER56_07765 [Hyphomicrobiales bacterium]|nr:hypothetical protein [Hyphomicrobiales bacterium]
MKRLVSLACVLGALIGLSTGAVAGVRQGNDGPTLVWVTIKALPGEGLWHACRRVYQRDVYLVLGAHGGKVRCKIDHSRIYDYGERRQNFNN